MHLRLICLLTMLLPVLLWWSPEVGARSFTIALDAGHGGKDIGCRGASVREKDVTLDVAKRLGNKIEKQFGDSVKVIYTRTDDSFVSLDRRARIANDADADLFISIHVNSVDARTKGRRNIHGASVYTVGLHKSEANLAVAMRENSVIELEPDMSEVYQDFDPNQSESYIIFELTQNVHFEQSIKMAALAQDALVAHAGRADKGVRQAGFLVLWATRMPAVLVELDFICNPEAEAFLGSKDGREKCADALLKAVEAYMNTSVN
ncbi:MAG: N-acetylmuramoyl-L-alanine amidase [Bacteroidales bacterium]|nr:N-acetylmuramoyl-L-alanine amidase [Bacteroidales bacterium]